MALTVEELGDRLRGIRDRVEKDCVGIFVSDTHCLSKDGTQTVPNYMVCRPYQDTKSPEFLIAEARTIEDAIKAAEKKLS